MTQINKRDLEFRQMLTNLSLMINDDELSRMKFQCKSVSGITGAMRDKMKTSLDLWEKLEERGHLGPTKLTFLKQLVENCTNSRTDVQKVVKQYEESLHGSSSGQNDFHKEINFLVDNLGKDWKFFMRALGLQESKLEMCMESHPRNVQEQIYMAFQEWQADEKSTKEDMERALREIHRNDLLHKLFPSP